jgi:hypothetical protein
MSVRVEVEKADASGIKAASLCHQMIALSERIRQRAFQFFEKRGRRDGFADEDWLRAEQDLLLAAESEMVDHHGKFEIRVNTPGFDSDEIKVTSLPDALVVEAGCGSWLWKDVPATDMMKRRAWCNFVSSDTKRSSGAST